MKIKVLETNTYPSYNFIDAIPFNADIEYPVLDHYVSGGSTVYHVKNENGAEALILDKFCTVVAEPKPENVLGTENRRFVYVLVRTDMDLHNIIVQSSHAAYQSGLEFKNHADRTTIIVLAVKNEMELREAYHALERTNIQCTMYKEHTLGLGFTAVGTEALTQEQRKLLKKYKLLKVQE